MPIQHTILSDLTGKELGEKALHIYKQFWYYSEFDTWTLSMYTDKNELEKLFGKEIIETTNVWLCVVCSKDIIDDTLSHSDLLIFKSLDWFRDLLEERSLAISQLWWDLCNDCMKKYFQDFIKYSD